MHMVSNKRAAVIGLSVDIKLPEGVVKSFNKWAFLLPKTLLDGFLQLLYPVGVI